MKTFSYYKLQQF